MNQCAVFANGTLAKTAVMPAMLISTANPDPPERKPGASTIQNLQQPVCP